MMSNPCRVKITMDADGPILWTVDRHTGAPIEAFQPDWKNGGSWHDVLSYSWLDVALDIPTPDRRDGFRVHLQAPNVADLYTYTDRASAFGGRCRFDLAGPQRLEFPTAAALDAWLAAFHLAEERRLAASPTAAPLRITYGF